MSQIKVEYMDHMGNDSSVTNAARVSFSKFKETFDEADEKLVSFLAREGHTTPFRHTQIQVRCKAPIFIARQLGKHQIGMSWNEVSRRYVDSTPEFFYPEVWRSRPEGGIKQGSGKQFNDLVQFNLEFDREYNEHEKGDIEEAYDYVINTSLDMYDQFIQNGVAPEMARMLLPQSMMTEWVWSGNLMAFAHVYNLRIDTHAQVEAQEFAKQLGEVMEKLFPVAWKALTTK